MSELVSPASMASWPEPGAEMPASSLKFLSEKIILKKELQNLTNKKILIRRILIN
jgi:hypothetical protein